MFLQEQSCVRIHRDRRESSGLDPELNVPAGTFRLRPPGTNARFPPRRHSEVPRRRCQQRNDPHPGGIGAPWRQMFLQERPAMRPVPGRRGNPLFPFVDAVPLPANGLSPRLVSQGRALARPGGRMRPPLHFALC